MRNTTKSILYSMSKKEDEEEENPGLTPIFSTKKK